MNFHIKYGFDKVAYQISKVCARRFWKFFPHMTRGQFLPQGYNVNSLGIGSPDKTKYQMSKASAF